jgi:predicted RNase H-like HicB family nuclease
VTRWGGPTRARPGGPSRAGTVRCRTPAVDRDHARRSPPPPAPRAPAAANRYVCDDSSGVPDFCHDARIALTAAITHEGEWYVARCLQVEVTSQGETIEEALANLREALELYFEDAPAPEVTDVITAPVEVRVA